MPITVEEKTLSQKQIVKTFPIFKKLLFLSKITPSPLTEVFQDVSILPFPTTGVLYRSAEAEYLCHKLLWMCATWENTCVQEYKPWRLLGTNTESQ